METQEKRYTTKEVLDMVGIARATLYKWLRDGKALEVPRDRNNYRVFTDKDIKHLLEYKNLIKTPIKSYMLKENKDIQIK